LHLHRIRYIVADVVGAQRSRVSLKHRVSGVCMMY